MALASRHLLLGSLLVFVTACSRDVDASSPDTIAVGVTVETTGPLPALGRALEGIEAAAAYLNEHGGIDGREVDLVVRDNAGDPSRAISDIREFEDQGIGVVLGPVSGPNCLATANEAAGADLVEFCISGANLPEQDDHMFGIGTDYTATVQADFDLMEDLGGGEVAVFAPDSQSGDEVARLAGPAAEQRGMDLGIERHDTTATSLWPQVQQVLADGADVLYLTSCAPVSITAAREAIELGFEGPIVIQNCHVSETSAEAVSEFANDQVMVLAPQFMLGEPEAEDPRAGAIDLYQQEVGEPDIVVAAGWDALMMAAEAIEAAGSADAESVLSELRSGFTYTGVWAWNEIEGDEHRGSRPDGALIPAYISRQATFVAL